MITIRVTSDLPGEGKTTVSGIILEALRRCGYDVVIAPVPHPMVAATADSDHIRHWEKAERIAVADVERRIAASGSHPKSHVRLVVTG